jgi:hypothetical protein
MINCPNCHGELSPEFLDELTEPNKNLRPFTVKYEYFDEAAAYHSFFSLEGALRDARQFVADESGTCLIMGPEGFSSEIA